VKYRLPNPKSTEQSRGSQTRDAIVSRAVEIASLEGLGSLTIGRLASDLRMSKSGLFVHFGSKQKLQLATIERAREIFHQKVIFPAESAPKGIARLWVLCDSWIDHIENRTFPGTFFFTTAFFAHSRHSGRIAREIVAVMQAWLEVVKRAVREAKKLKELDSKADPRLIAYQLTSMLIGAYATYLLENRDALTEARKAVLGKLRELATDNVPAGALKSVDAWRKHLEKAKRSKLESYP
jgi:AcrR family transcriptional regulator